MHPVAVPIGRQPYLQVRVEGNGDIIGGKDLSVTLRGRHFLQLPGPSNVPDRILRAIDRPTIDHRGPEFAELGTWLLDGLRRIFKTEHDVIMYPGSGTGGSYGQ